MTGTWSGLRSRQVLVIASAVVATTLLGACTGEDEASVASAGETPVAPSATASDLYAQELEFVSCMRAQGIADMPDPVPGDAVGRSALRHAMNVMGKAPDPVFRAALESCLGLLPAPPPPEPPSPDEVQARHQFARCMRDNDIHQFPDPGPGGELIVVLYPDDGLTVAPTGPIMVEGEDVVVVNIVDPIGGTAWEACKRLYPPSTHGWGAL